MKVAKKFAAVAVSAAMAVSAFAGCADTSAEDVEEAAEDVVEAAEDAAAELSVDASLLLSSSVFSTSTVSVDTTSKNSVLT